MVLSGNNYVGIPGFGPATGNASAGTAADQIASGTPHMTIPGGTETLFGEGPIRYATPTYTPTNFAMPYNFTSPLFTGRY